MIQRLLALWRKPPIVSVTEFTDFLERNAWLVTQKSIVGYCTVKTRLPIHEMAKEKQFTEAYEVATWESYAAVLADLMEVALGYLRSADETQAGAWAARLGDFYESLVRSHPVPPHRADSGWDAEIAALKARPARQIREISRQSAKVLFLKLPIHSRLREPDEPAVVANVQFLMVGLAHEFDRIDFASLGPMILSQQAT